MQSRTKRHQIARYAREKKRAHKANVRALRPDIQHQFDRLTMRSLLRDGERKKQEDTLAEQMKRAIDRKLGRT